MRELQIGEDVVVQVPYPEEAVYENPKYQDIVYKEKHNPHSFDKVVYPAAGGRLLYVKGLPYPFWGMPDMEALKMVNYAKRVFINNIKTLSKNPLQLLSMLRMKNLNNWLDGYNQTAVVFLKGYYLQPRYWIPACWEILVFITKFLTELGVDAKLAHSFAKRVATLIEYDDAYRYRIEDLASTTTSALLIENPRREILKVMEILKQRDPRVKMAEHFGSIAKVLSMALYIPFVKRAFRKAMKSIHFENIQMDKFDTYHTLKYSDYLFGGRSAEDRMNELMTYHKDGLPNTTSVNN